MIATVVTMVVALACLGFGTTAFFALRHDHTLDRTSAAPHRTPAADPFPSDVPTDDPFPSDVPTDDPADPADPDDPADQAGATHDGDLKQFVVGRPAGARAWSGAPANQALDLKAAAANFADPVKGRRILQSFDFRDGYARRWVDQRGNYVTVRVLRFATPGDGDNFANFYIDSNQGTGWGDPQPVPGLARAAGFVQSKTAKNGLQRSLAVGDAGDIVAIVLADQVPPARPSVPGDQLAKEFDLL